MKRLFILLIAIISFASCKKEDAQKEDKDPICMEGRINWGGEPAADGSGWTFVLAETNQHYHLKDLPEAYKQEDLQVAVCIQETSERIRLFSPSQHIVYKIISIREK